MQMDSRGAFLDTTSVDMVPTEESVFSAGRRSASSFSWWKWQAVERPLYRSCGQTRLISLAAHRIDGPVQVGISMDLLWMSKLRICGISREY